MNSYQDGFKAGAAFARALLECPQAAVDLRLVGEPSRSDTVDLLNGFAAGIKYVAFPEAVYIRNPDLGGTSDSSI